MLSIRVFQALTKKVYDDASSLSCMSVALCLSYFSRKRDLHRWPYYRPLLVRPTLSTKENLKSSRALNSK